jgi:hypothetical protein
MTARLNDVTTFSFDQVKLALERCITAEPVTNYILSADTSHIATVFAEMLFAHEDERTFSSITSTQLAALRRWI